MSKRKPKAERKTNEVRIRLTWDQKRDLEEAAKREEETLSGFVRREALKSARAPRAMPVSQ